MDPILSLMELLSYIDDTTGSITISIDAFYPTHMGQPDVQYGFVVRTMIGHATYYGIAVTLEEAIQILTDKINKKYGKP